MKTLKILILFVIVLSGCSKDYLVGTREELAGRESFSSQDELDVKVVSRDNNSFSLGVQIKKIVVVADSLKLEEIYRRGTKEAGGIQVLLGGVVGLGGCIMGYSYARSGDLVNNGSGRISRGRIMSCVSGILGLALFKEGISQGSEFVKIASGFMKTDTVYVDSVFLLEQRMKVSVENSDFEKVYYTDERGNVDIRVDEVLAEQSKSDSILDVVIRYQELADTVNLKLSESL